MIFDVFIKSFEDEFIKPEFPKLFKRITQNFFVAEYTLFDKFGNRIFREIKLFDDALCENQLVLAHRCIREEHSEGDFLQNIHVRNVELVDRSGFGLYDCQFASSDRTFDLFNKIKSVDINFGFGINVNRTERVFEDEISCMAIAVIKVPEYKITDIGHQIDRVAKDRILIFVTVIVDNEHPVTHKLPSLLKM